MPSKGVLRGAKVTRNHSNVIPEAEAVVRLAKKLPNVSKVVIGKVVSAKLRSGSPRLDFKPVLAGWKVQVRGVHAVQTLYLYTEDPFTVQVVIAASFVKQFC